jgi:hypothetical protein
MMVAEALTYKLRLDSNDKKGLNSMIAEAPT